MNDYQTWKSSINEGDTSTVTGIDHDGQLLSLLEMKSEQLRDYLEQLILDNPFVEIDYEFEKQLAVQAHKLSTRDIPVSQPTQTLPMFLFEQIMTYRQTMIRDTMVKLVDYVNEQGYIPFTYQELAEKLGINAVIVLDALTLIKQLEPTGVGAYDTRECLMLQTEQDSQAPDVAYYLLEEFFIELKEQNYAKIQEVTSLSLEDIQECVKYYATLRPIPATLFDNQPSEYLIPDVSIQADMGEVLLVYNRQYSPQLIFNQTYYDEMLASGDEEVLNFIEPLQKAYDKTVAQLQLRERVILKMAQVIWNTQRDYLTHLSEEKVPLLIKDIANELQLPELFIQRAIVNKNLEFESQVYPLTDFITVANEKGRGGFTAANVKRFITDIIQESTQEMSNEAIAKCLEEKGIIISPLMVNNYRQTLQ